MSFIYRDYLTPARHKWNKASSLYHRFDSAWGRTTIDGIEVYQPRLYWYMGAVRNDTPFNRFINALGITRESLTNNNFDHIEACWFWLNHAKYSYTPKEKAAIVADINNAFSVGDEFEVSITYGGETRRTVDTHYVHDPVTGSYTIDKDAIREKLDSNPILYYANASTASAGISFRNARPMALGQMVQRNTAQTVSSPITPVCQTSSDAVINNIALLDNESMFSRVGSVYGEQLEVHEVVKGIITYRYSYKYKYRVIAVADLNSYVVNQVDLVSNAMQSSMILKKGTLAARSNAAIDTLIKRAVLEMNNGEALPMFYQGHLRCDAAAVMPRQKFFELIAKTIDTGFQQQKAKWYEKFFAVIIIVIAIVVAVVSYGGGSTFAAAMVSLAESLAMAGAVLTIGLITFSMAFPYSTDNIRMIGGAAQIVGVAAAITGVFAMITAAFNQFAQRAGEKALADGASKEAAAAVVENYGVKDFVVDYVKDWFSTKWDAVGNLFSGQSFSSDSLSKVTLSDVSGWIDNMNEGMKMYFKFFGDKPQNDTPVSQDQVQRENGVQSIFVAQKMIDEKDALHKMDMLKNNSFGGQMTENYMAKII